MCGRFALGPPAKSLAGHFSLDDVPDIPPRYNIAPSQDVATVSRDEPGSPRNLVMRRWGLVPSWAKDMKIGARLINARSETAAEKPAFRAAFRSRRCLIPASGFYEWKRRGDAKQPYFFAPAGDDLMSFAGLWERWDGGDGTVESCTILTTGPNELMEPIHNRMPVIVTPDDYDLWLDTGSRDMEHLERLFSPVEPSFLTVRPVSTRVNSPRNEGSGLIEAVDD